MYKNKVAQNTGDEPFDPKSSENVNKVNPWIFWAEKRNLPEPEKKFEVDFGTPGNS